MPQFYDRNEEAGWSRPSAMKNRRFTCGFCNTTVSSVLGLKFGRMSDGSGNEIASIHICSNCNGPNTLTPTGFSVPGYSFGSSVESVPHPLNDLYEEARRCTSQNCYTAAVLLCRKMLMNIAVEQNAGVGLSFQHYVEYLAGKGYVPPNGKHWVDHIRKKGNEAAHEVAIMGRDDARDIILFSEMLLRFIYEFPSLVPSPTPPP